MVELYYDDDDDGNNEQAGRAPRRIHVRSSRRSRIIITVALVSLTVVAGLLAIILVHVLPSDNSPDATLSSSTVEDAYIGENYRQLSMSLIDFDGILSSDVHSVDLRSASTADAIGSTSSMSREGYNTAGANYDNDENTTDEEKEKEKDWWDSMTNLSWKSIGQASALQHLLSKQQNAGSNTDTDMLLPTHFPFIVCGKRSDLEDGADRIQYTMMMLGYTVEDYTPFTRPIANVEGLACVYAYMNMSAVSGSTSINNAISDLDPTIAAVHPMSPMMKIREGTVEKLSQLDVSTTIQVEFCPGAATSTSTAVHVPNESSGSSDDEEEEALRLAESIMALLYSSDDAHRRNQQRSLREQHHHQTRSLFWEGSSSNAECPYDVLQELRYDISNAGEYFTIYMPDDETKLPTNSCMLYILSHLSSHPAVCSISLSDPIHTVNVQAQWIVQSGTTNERPWFDVGLDGAGQVVSVSDTGLDVDNCYFWDKSGEVTRDGSVDLSRRKVVQYYPYKDSTDELNGHGTHTASTILGKRARDGATESDGVADGIATGAKIAFFDLAQQIGGSFYMSVPSSAFDYVGTGEKAGAKIHSASWGTQTQNNYGTLDQAMDNYLYAKQDSIIVTAAGNRGAYGLNTVASPSISKNTIVVGASQSSGPDIFGGMLGEDYLAYFTAKGPTRDGRMGPMIIAPGSFILSAAAIPNKVGECDDSSGTRYDQGTSMSTPVVAGAVAIIRQYFEEGWYPTGKKNSDHVMNPSGALLKAVLLNGAQSLKGIQTKEGSTVQVADYDESVGFGRINLLASLPLDEANSLKSLVFDRKYVFRGETQSLTFHIDTSNGCDIETVSATLVWTDPPAATGCNHCLINDLDLSMEKSGSSQIFYPNGRDDRDSLNNAERIRVPVIHGDEFKISVYGQNLLSSSQPYALVVTGCVIEGPVPPIVNNPTLQPVPAPTDFTTVLPSSAPSNKPTQAHTAVSERPTKSPIITPAPANPTEEPTKSPIITSAPANPTSLPTKAPLTTSPTMTPTNRPTTPAPTLPPPSVIPQSISTNFTGNIASYGNMFDLIAKKDISVTGFSIHVASNAMEMFEIYTRGGSHVQFSRRPTAWSFEGSTIVFGKGENVATPVPGNAFAPINIGASMTKGIYVTITNPNMKYSIGTGTGNISIENSDLALLEGIGKAYAFRNTYEDRIWNGILYYSIPSIFETAHPDDDEFEDGVNITSPSFSPSRTDEQINESTFVSSMHKHHQQS